MVNTFNCIITFLVGVGGDSAKGEEEANCSSVGWGGDNWNVTHVGGLSKVLTFLGWVSISICSQRPVVRGLLS